MSNLFLKIWILSPLMCPGAKTLIFFFLTTCVLLMIILFYPQSAFYPWSAVCILPRVCILPPVCSLQSAFCTDRKFTEKELKVQATKEQMIIEGIKPSNTRPVCKCIYWRETGKSK